MVGDAALTRLLVAFAPLVAAASTATDVPASAWTVECACRDGRAQGPYLLKSADGRLRIAGAFNEGRRTGSFIFWAENGVRAAHVPFDDDIRNGTVATWYPGIPGREPARRFESTWHRGSRDGLTRSWYADGQRRSETEYAAGRVVASSGWTDAGAAVGDAAAREFAERDAAAADATYAKLDALIRDHLPRCE